MRKRGRPVIRLDDFHDNLERGDHPFRERRRAPVGHLLRRTVPRGDAADVIDRRVQLRAPVAADAQAVIVHDVRGDVAPRPRRRRLPSPGLLRRRLVASPG